MSISMLCALAASTALAQAPAAQDISVVVADANPVKAMSAKSVQDVFTARRQQWASGKAITLVMLDAAAPLHAEFCRRALEKGSAGLDQAHLEKRYRKQLTLRVVRAATPDDVARLVRADPTAIGYLPAALASDGVRAVQTFKP